jgi:hypothetical protein
VTFACVNDTLPRLLHRIEAPKGDGGPAGYKAFSADLSGIEAELTPSDRKAVTDGISRLWRLRLEELARGGGSRRSPPKALEA